MAVVPQTITLATLVPFVDQLNQRHRDRNDRHPPARQCFLRGKPP